jgi:hypothetical protein
MLPLSNEIAINTGLGTVDIAANSGRELVLAGKVTGTGNWIKNNSGSTGAARPRQREQRFCRNTDVFRRNHCRRSE